MGLVVQVYNMIYYVHEITNPFTILVNEYYPTGATCVVVGPPYNQSSTQMSDFVIGKRKGIDTYFILPKSEVGYTPEEAILKKIHRLRRELKETHSLYIEQCIEQLELLMLKRGSNVQHSPTFNER